MSSYLPSEGVRELWCVSSFPICLSFVDGRVVLANTEVGRMVDRKARTWEKVVIGREYVFDGDSVRRFCSRAGSDRCHCDHGWDKFELVGSWDFFLIGMWVQY